MAELFYRDDRDCDFFNVCEQVQKEKGNIPVSEIVSEAVLRPAGSFYLHRKEYVAIIRKNGNKLPKSSTKRLLHIEVLGRYRRLKKQNPELTPAEIAKIIEAQKAPRFYISNRRGEDIYYQILKKPHSSYL